jgi:hypothetical protein
VVVPPLGDVAAAVEGSGSTRGATELLPALLICIGNQPRCIIAHIYQQAAARKVMNLVCSFNRCLPADNLRLNPAIHHSYQEFVNITEQNTQRRDRDFVLQHEEKIYEAEEVIIAHTEVQQNGLKGTPEDRVRRLSYRNVARTPALLVLAPRYFLSTLFHLIALQSSYHSTKYNILTFKRYQASKSHADFSK